MMNRVLAVILILMSLSCSKSDISTSSSLQSSTWHGYQVDTSGSESPVNVYFSDDSEITIVLSHQSGLFTYGPYQTNITSKSIEILTPSLREEDPVWYIKRITSSDLHLIYMPNSPLEKKLILKRG